MSKWLIALVLCVSVGLAWADGPCAIRHYTHDELCAAAQKAKCPQKCAPCPPCLQQPCPPCPVCQPCPPPPPTPEPVVVERYIESDPIYVPEQPKGQWLLPLSVFRISDDWGGGAGLAYLTPKHWLISGQVLYYTGAGIESNGFSGSETCTPELRAQGSCLTPPPKPCLVNWDCPGCSEKNSWGWQFTVGIPLWRDK